MDAATLYDAIAEVSPVASTSVGKADDRSTWTWVPGANATQPQIDAGNNVVATIPVETKATMSTADFIGRFTNAEYRAATATTWRQTAGNAKNWDVVVFEPSINMNKKKVTTLKDSLVTDGILTQARADEIFA
jgi:predicted extracellular nuclease